MATGLFVCHITGGDGGLLTSGEKLMDRAQVKVGPNSGNGPNKVGGGVCVIKIDHFCVGL